MSPPAITTTPTATAAARGNSLRWLVSDSLVIAGRSLAHIRQIPEKLIDVTLQPIMFVILFAFVFGGVIAVPGGDYREYLIGGILVQTIAFGMVGPAGSIATDISEGIIDRFRALPMSRFAYLMGHLAAELAGMILAIAVLSLSGLIIGWQIDSSIGDAVLGYLVLILFAVVMTMIGTLVGLVARSADAVMGPVFLIVFPMTFLASTFVPIEGLPDGLRQIAEWNPVSALATATRELFGNPTATPVDPAWPLAHPVAASLIWCVGLIAIVAPLTVRAFQRRTTD